MRYNNIYLIIKDVPYLSQLVIFYSKTPYFLKV